ncbi:MAG: flagellar basal body P-ring formation protein FlgA [Paracoccaceae bacterium]|nr:flagellar basal body P-ring formation protein FlgA [Paracoccaceae bacterium]
MAQAAPRETADHITAAIHASLGSRAAQVMPNGGTMMPACTAPLAVSLLPSTDPGFRTASVTCPSPSWTIFAGVSLSRSVAALVATRPIAPGAAIDASDTETRPVAASAVHGTPLSPDSLTEGLRARQAIPAGQAITETMTDLQIAVRSGQQVSLRVRQGDLVISTGGIVLQNGAVGDTVEVENAASHRKLRAIVVRTLPARSGIYAIASDAAGD